MAKVSIIFEDQLDENGEEGLAMKAPELTDALKEQEGEKRFSAATVAALTIVRMMESNALQPHMAPWCQDLINFNKMEEARSNALKKAPEDNIVSFKPDNLDG